MADIFRRMKFLNNQKMITQFLVLYLVIIALPIVALAFYSFNELKKMNEEQLIQNLDNYMVQSINNVNEKINEIDQLAQLTVNKKGLSDYLIDKRDLSVEELMFFKDNYASDMERIRNANTDVFQLRLYLRSENILEMWPTIYSEKRLIYQDWVDEINFSNKESLWKIFTKELVIPRYSYDKSTRPRTIVAYYSQIRSRNIYLGLLEVNMDVKVFFSGMFAENELNGEGFTVVKQKNGDFHFNYENYFLSKRDIDYKLLEKQLYDKTENDKGYFNLDILGENVLVAYDYIERLDMYMYNAISTGFYDNKYNEQRNILIAIGVSMIIVLSILTYIIIAMILKRLNKVIGAMRQVQDGNMDVKIDIDGSDEISELAYHMKKMLTRINELIALVLKKQEVTKDAEIKALQTQINAHFIYNTLETIKMMAEIQDQFMISDSITSLGRLMRYSMSWSTASVQLSEELNYVKNYIALLNIRRENEIILNFSIEEGLQDYNILKMSVQPIIENAVRHGIEPCESEAVIKIKAFSNNGEVYIEITDNGIGMAPEEVIKLQNTIDGIENTVYNAKGNGIGLHNINERIQIFYGKQYGIKVISKKECYTKIRMELPLVLEIEEG